MLDDNADIPKTVTEVLVYKGIEVRGISQGAELFTTAQAYRPDMIPLDLKIPDVHGGELCQQLKIHPQLKDIFAVIFTAYQNANEDLSRCCCNAVIHNLLIWIP